MARATTNFGSLICDALDLYFPSSVCVDSKPPYNTSSALLQVRPQVSQTENPENENTPISGHPWKTSFMWSFHIT